MKKFLLILSICLAVAKTQATTCMVFKADLVDKALYNRPVTEPIDVLKGRSPNQVIAIEKSGLVIENLDYGSTTNPDTLAALDGAKFASISRNIGDSTFTLELGDIDINTLELLHPTVAGTTPPTTPFFGLFDQVAGFAFICSPTPWTWSGGGFREN